MKKIILTGLLIFSFALFSKPADAQYKIVNYTDMNQINSLTEDGDFVWVCTSGGAFKRKKSDGSLVKVFNIENSGISRNAVQCMYIDVHGNYWFGTYNGGISMFDGSKWTNITKINGDYISTISTITEDLSGNLWFGEMGKAFKFDGTNWTKYTLSGSYFVKSIVPDDEGNIWFGIIGYHGAFWKLDVSDVLTRIPGPGNKFIDDDGPYDILKDSYGNLWIAYYGGAYKFNPKTDNWTDYGSQAGFNVYAITQDGLGRIWFGTAGGVIRYDGNSFKTYTSGRTIDRGDMALDVLADAQGNVWIGGYVGYAKVDEVNDTWTNPILLNSLPSNYVETLVFDSNKKAWVFGQFQNCFKFDGTYWTTVPNNGSTPYSWTIYSAIDASNNKYIPVMTGPSFDKLGLIKIDNSGNHSTVIISGSLTFTYSSEVVKEMIYDGTSGKIFIATTHGIFWYKTTDGTKGQYIRSNSSIAADTINGLAVSGTKLWYSTSWTGIGYLDLSNNSWKKYTTADGAPSNSAGRMVFDKSDNLWYISSGLTKWNGSSFQTWYPPNGSSAIAADHDGNIWVGGFQLSKFRDGVFKLYSIDNGLIENSVRNIVVDPDNNIWIATRQYGLTKMIPQAPVAEFSSEKVCLPGSTNLTNLSGKTDELTTYQWDINNDGSIEYTTKDVSHVFSSKGIYPVRLKVSNDGLSNEVVQDVQVLESPDLSLDIEGNKAICYGSSQDVSVIINNPDPLLSYQVSWNNGISGTQQIYVNQTGEYYATVSNGECSSQSPSLNLSVSEPFSDEKICMVTVDPETGKNMIVWERTPDAGIESYNVYKLFGNSYVPVGNVSSGDVSQYIDYTSSPGALAARYAISSIDTCGNESAKSAYHQTIYLGASEGIEPNTVVLDWTNYIDESKIWQPEYYYIYRGGDPSKLNLIDSVSSAFTEWTDQDPMGSRYYRILIKKSSPCSPALYKTKKASSGPYVHSLSNLEDNRLINAIDLTNAAEGISVYPNPFKTETTIHWNNPENFAYTLKVIDLKGSVLIEVNNIHESLYKLSRSGLQSGVYFIELSGKDIFRSRLIVD
ncbi:MAG: T9SS type A sorting domain-containing protein [Bacteroidales bacterium]|nr:T9SS type A sorting domain-containing protein [Bacteroidales bacterium]MCB9013516.1 T9SS type A sorting domain-containing protein [Bacteroidales bacterium]